MGRGLQGKVEWCWEGWDGEGVGYTRLSAPYGQLGWEEVGWGGGSSGRGVEWGSAGWNK